MRLDGLDSILRLSSVSSPTNSLPYELCERLSLPPLLLRPVRPLARPTALPSLYKHTEKGQIIKVHIGLRETPDVILPNLINMHKVIAKI